MFKNRGLKFSLKMCLLILVGVSISKAQLSSNSKVNSQNLPQQSTSISTPISQTQDASKNTTAVLIDILGASQGYSNIALDFKLQEKTSGMLLTGTRLIENDDKTVSTTILNGFLINKYIVGETNKPSVTVGIGPLGIIYIDKAKITKNLAFAAQVAGQIYLQDKVLVRLYLMGATQGDLGIFGLQFGFGF